MGCLNKKRPNPQHPFLLPRRSRWVFEAAASLATVKQPKGLGRPCGVGSEHHSVYSKAASSKIGSTTLLSCAHTHAEAESDFWHDLCKQNCRPLLHIHLHESKASTPFCFLSASRVSIRRILPKTPVGKRAPPFLAYRMAMPSDHLNVFNLSERWVCQKATRFP